MTPATAPSTPPPPPSSPSFAANLAAATGGGSGRGGGGVGRREGVLRPLFLFFNLASERRLMCSCIFLRICVCIFFSIWRTWRRAAARRFARSDALSAALSALFSRFRAATSGETVHEQFVRERRVGGHRDRAAPLGSPPVTS